jgi:hypothetical protein
MARRSEKPEKKLRGIPRRLRSLTRWSESIAERFPSESDFHSPGYWNHKIPVDWALVEGKQTNATLRKECAQLLVDACKGMIKNKPEWAKHYRVTCCICLPDMHSSELCIYAEEGYYAAKAGNDRSQYGSQELIEGRSLANEWALDITGIQELGVCWRYDQSPDPQDHYVSDHWMFGEVSR